MITFTDTPTHPPFPAYNNSVVRFKVEGEETTPTIAIITVGGVSFEVYPDAGGEFYFNFKNIIPSLINKSNFADNVPPPNGNWLQTDPDLFHEITAEIQVMLEEGEPENTEVTFPFLKSVLQKGQRRHVNSDLRPLDHSISQLSHLTYFEGMPFDVSIYSDQEREVTIRNAKTGMQVTRTFAKGVNRLFISSGENDSPEGFENDLPLYLGVNELEFITSQGIRFTLLLDKRPAECGQLLKWFNPAGGWSYWRFSDLLLETTTTRTIERLHGDFDNLDNSRWNVSITGKDVSREQELRSGLLTTNELEYVKHITAAPKVYLYVGDLYQPYQKQDFIEVEVTGRITTSTKPKMKELAVTMLLPTQYSQTLW